MSELKIAIVDDHQLFADAIKNVLPIYGNIKSLITFNTGRALFTHLELNEIDLVLLDLGIKDGDNGFDILADLKQRKPHIKIIVVSMHTQQEYVSKVKKLGGNGYVPKDAGVKILKEAINKIYTGDIFYNASEAALANPFDALSPAENKVAIEILRGKNNREIAEEFFRSQDVIKTHRKSIYRKLDVNNVVEFTKLGVKYGIITDTIA